MRVVLFIVLIVGCVLLALGAPELAHPASKYPPQYGVYVRIAQCEQPAPIKYKQHGRWPADMRWGVWWRQTHNWSFRGGGGMQTYLWTQFRRPLMKRVATMDRAPIHEQLYAMHRLYVWAEKTYPGAGYTAWDCAKKDWFR